MHDTTLKSHKKTFPFNTVSQQDIIYLLEKM